MGMFLLWARFYWRQEAGLLPFSGAACPWTSLCLSLLSGRLVQVCDCSSAGLYVLEMIQSLQIKGETESSGRELRLLLPENEA